MKESLVEVSPSTVMQLNDCIGGFAQKLLQQRRGDAGVGGDEGRAWLPCSAGSFRHPC
jgi:hypothetical protein